MIFESSSTNGIGLIGALAKMTGSEIKNGRLNLPDTLGKGYLQFYDLGTSLRMMVTECELKEEMVLKRSGSDKHKNEITFSFRNVFPQSGNRLLPSVQVSSSDIDLEVVTPARTILNSILIISPVERLKELLGPGRENSLRYNILSGKQPYLYEEMVSPEMRSVAAAIAAIQAPEELQTFYLNLKATELIYLFFLVLSKREDAVSYPLSTADVKMIYLIRDRIIADLAIPPKLEELAISSNMSESKMNRLFRQIFGKSIYNYYQSRRMEEAAHLIKVKKYSVSEAGYSLGFTNLSHFTRLFEEHIGMKPKKYSAL